MHSLHRIFPSPRARYLSVLRALKIQHLEIEHLVMISSYIDLSYFAPVIENSTFVDDRNITLKSHD